VKVLVVIAEAAVDNFECQREIGVEERCLAGLDEQVVLTTK